MNLHEEAISLKINESFYHIIDEEYFMELYQKSYSKLINGEIGSVDFLNAIEELSFLKRNFPGWVRQNRKDCLSEVIIQSLEKFGFFVASIWHIGDVKMKNPEISDEVCMDILHRAITSEVIYNDVWKGIGYAIEQEGYEVKK